MFFIFYKNVPADKILLAMLNKKYNKLMQFLQLKLTLNLRLQFSINIHVSVEEGNKNKILKYTTKSKTTFRASFLFLGKISL